MIYQLLMMQDIKLDEVLFFHVEKMMRAVKEHTVKEFKTHKFPVTKDQWVILKRIADEDGSNQKEIAESTFKDPASLTRILDLLEKKGLVKRESSLNDRRTFIIRLTVDGKRLVDKMIPVVQEIRKRALKGISKSEEEIAKKVMGKIYNNI